MPSALVTLLSSACSRWTGPTHFFNRKPVLFAAKLQDYSYRLTKLISLQPAQFCKAGDSLQYRVSLGDISSARGLALARRIDVSSDQLDIEDVTDVTDDTMQCGPGEEGEPGASNRAPPQLLSKHVKRLGFGGLEREPEYLLDRLL